MNKLEIFIQEMQKNWSSAKVILNLTFLVNEINNVFLKIKEYKTVYEAEKDFLVLNEIQKIIAKLWMEDEIEISVELKKFVRDFDRIDSSIVQKTLFYEIHTGKYPHMK